MGFTPVQDTYTHVRTHACTHMHTRAHMRTHVYTPHKQVARGLYLLEGRKDGRRLNKNICGSELTASLEVEWLLLLRIIIIM